MFLSAVVVAFVLVSASARPDPYRDPEESYHQHSHRRISRSIRQGLKEEEFDATFWNQQAQKTVQDLLLKKPNTNVAKNVIFFLGDGMSIPTLKAARVYLGQRYNESGEETQLSFEKFPYTALSKTYCVDRQVPDSACTATAYLCGVKANEATIGVTARVLLDDCQASLDESNQVSSIGRWSQLKGKRTGIVTSTRVTHASPAGVYANIANRDWESNSDVISPDCTDIAHQLVHGKTGNNFNVILGGGRREFLPNTTVDEEGQSGRRTDDRNLVEEWLATKDGQQAQYVWNRTSLLEVQKDTDYLLGLFESSHCKYHLDATDLEPSLEEMTEAAIKILSKSENGFFLFVEGGRIDHAHHDTLAQKALDETVEFSKAIQKAYDLTNPEETLIVVTSDHAHTMSVSGYPERGNNILGIAGTADDELPYATLSYANGPSYKPEENGVRYDLSKDDMNDKDYKFPAMAPLSSETHGGDDVGIFAVGPWAHLFSGVIEENVIPHAMAFASCVGDGLTVCDQEVRRRKNADYQR